MRRVLLVEDEPILAEMYLMILSTQPYICDHVENGKVALQKCKDNDYDLVLLDIMMPEMNGVEFLENLEDIDAMKSKIIVMSNLSSGKEINRVRELGVHKNILKSDVSPSQLISEIRYHFGA